MRPSMRSTPSTPSTPLSPGASRLPPLRARLFPYAGTWLAGMLFIAGAGCGDDDPMGTPDAGTPGTPDGGAPDAEMPDADVPGAVQIQILAFNDLHGNLEPPGGSGGRVQVGAEADGTPVTVDAGGAAFFARHLAELRATQPNTVVVSAGDLIGASPLISALFHDEPTIEAMGMAGLDINAVGNHEFDEGADELLRMQNGGCHPVDGCQGSMPFAGAGFGFLAANVVDEQGETLLPAYDIRELDGVKVAFIGMTLEGTSEIVTPAGVTGLTFRDEVETVNELVPVLQDQGVHAIVVVLHEGGRQAGLYDQCDGISGPVVEIVEGVDDEVDVFITGHTHQAYNCVIDNKLVTSAASFGRLITDIDLTVDPATGDVVDFTARNVIVTRDVPVADDVQALIDDYASKVEPLRQRRIGEVEVALGRTSDGETPTGESLLGNVIADAQLAATRDQALGGAQIAFMNPGGIRADLDAGEVSYGEAFTVQPFGNNLVTLTLTGAQIDTLLEQQFNGDNVRILQVSQGFSYNWDASAADGARVDPSTITLDGEVIDPAADYRVTVNNFLSSGGDGFSVLVEGRALLGGVVDLDALEAYLAANDPLAAPALGRITRAE